MLKLYKNAKGEKLYPVCSWEANQHKLFNAHDRIMNRIYDLEHADVMDNAVLFQAYEKQEKIEHLLDVFSSYVYGGIAYATWADRNILMEIFAAYDVRHDMAGAWRC